MNLVWKIDAEIGIGESAPGPLLNRWIGEVAIGLSAFHDESITVIRQPWRAAMIITAIAEKWTRPG